MRRRNRLARCAGELIEGEGADTQGETWRRGVAVVLNRGRVYVIDHEAPWLLGDPPPRPARICDYVIMSGGIEWPRGIQPRV
jgi:hypothetical protein